MVKIKNDDFNYTFNELKKACEAIYITAAQDPITVCDLLAPTFSLHVIYKDGTNTYITAGDLQTAFVSALRRIPDGK